MPDDVTTAADREAWCTRERCLLAALGLCGVIVGWMTTRVLFEFMEGL